MNRRQVKSGPSSSPEEVGRVHLPGIDAHDHETFCGFCWSGNVYEDTEDPVDCRGCIGAATESMLVLKDWKRPS